MRLLISAIVISSCTVLAAKADEEQAGIDLSGVWYGMGDGVSFAHREAGGVLVPAPNGLLPDPPTFYTLELTAASEKVEGTLTVGIALDTRSSTRRAMGALGLPGNGGPNVPTLQPIAGVVDGTTLVVETTSVAAMPITVMADVGGNRIKAEFHFAEALVPGPNGGLYRYQPATVSTVVLRRCRPARDAASDACSVDALWEEYLRKNKRRMNRPSAPTADEVRRANDERSGAPANDVPSRLGRL